MANVSKFDTAAANNSDASPAGFPEGMAPSGLNDAAREVMAAIARWYNDQNGSLVSGGAGNAYTLTTNNVHAALGDQAMTVFRADRANTGAATLLVDGLAAKDLKGLGGQALKVNEIIANQVIAVAYNANQDHYTLLTPLSTQPGDDIDTLAENATAKILTGTERTKLAGIETAATADQTNAQIKTANEANANTNAFEDADESKLDGIEAGATADQTNAQIKTANEANANTNAFEDADESKLDGIEASATADQSNAEIKIAYEANANSNAFTDSDESKLDGIEAGATESLTKVWINFDGGGTIAIRSSNNVSSIADNGTGLYTINYGNALADSDYAVLVSGMGSSSMAVGGLDGGFTLGADVKSTTQCRVRFRDVSNTARDVNESSVAIIGN